MRAAFHRGSKEKLHEACQTLEQTLEVARTKINKKRDQIVVLQQQLGEFWSGTEQGKGSKGQTALRGSATPSSTFMTSKTVRCAVSTIVASSLTDCIQGEENRII